jgi:16S rRNA (guanine527-N7)-methyltransferase
MTTNAEPRQRFSRSEIEVAIAPMLLQPLSASAYTLLASYLQLLSHWNQKMNLTAVRDQDVLVRLHLAECLRAAQRIPKEVETVLDFGSGAGFPGIPMQIVRPELRVTLAESQKKKAAFLREVVRELRLGTTSIHAGRVEDMPATPVFDMVTLRAVDKMGDALRLAISRIRPSQGSRGGGCMVLTSQSEVAAVTSIHSVFGEMGAVAIDWSPPERIPGTDQRVILLGHRI